MSQIVKKALLCHASVGAKHCAACPYHHRTACARALADDARAYIETLEKRLATAEGMRREDRSLDGLERCQDGSPDSCRGCGYRDIDGDCGTDLMRDAAQLLRELMGKEA